MAIFTKIPRHAGIYFYCISLTLYIIGKRYFPKPGHTIPCFAGKLLGGMHAVATDAAAGSAARKEALDMEANIRPTFIVWGSGPSWVV